MTTTTSTAPSLKPAIGGMLDDISSPGYLQVNRVLELFDGQTVVKIVEVWVESPAATPSRTQKAPQKQKTPKGKKAKVPTSAA